MFTVPFAAVAQLIRPGFSRWQMSVGKYRYANKTYNDLIAQGTYQYGLTNDITLNSGLTTASGYTAGLAGLAFNTPLGAIASDITLSRTAFRYSAGETITLAWTVASSRGINQKISKVSNKITVTRIEGLEDPGL